MNKHSGIVLSALLAVALAAPAQAAGRFAPQATQVTETLSSAETIDLVYMREEEKLARDVYLGLYEQWSLTPFSNVASSEQQHMDALLKLLRKYRLPDPAAGMAIGEFSDATLQALYDRLMDQGGRSDVDAVLVGGVIEETDIRDIDAAMARADNADLDQTYARLQCGSRNHLRAFASLYQGLTSQPYTAQVIEQTTVDAILTSPMERCGR